MRRLFISATVLSVIFLGGSVYAQSGAAEQGLETASYYLAPVSSSRRQRQPASDRAGRGQHLYRHPARHRSGTALRPGLVRGRLRPRPPARAGFGRRRHLCRRPLRQHHGHEPHLRPPDRRQLLFVRLRRRHGRHTHRGLRRGRRGRERLRHGYTFSHARNTNGDDGDRLESPNKQHNRPRQAPTKTPAPPATRSARSKIAA